MKKRTTTRRRREMAEFISENRRLFPLVGLFLLGVVIGVAVYVAVGKSVTADWGNLLKVTGLSGGLHASLGALWSACFSSACFLAVLFLLGLWSCGAPFVLIVEVIHGIGLGLTQAYYYAMGAKGVAAVAAIIMPNGLLTAAVLIMAGTESMRLSMSLSRQLLPAASGDQTESGALWPSFRLYCLRYLLFLLAAIAVGLLDVLMRVLLWRLLPA